MKIAFFVLALIAVAGAVGVVSMRNVFHAAISMALAFFGVAGIYVLLSAEFLAAVQVLIYIGAIAVILVFAIMLTRPDIAHTNLSNRLRWPALAGSGVALAALIWTIVRTTWFVRPAVMHSEPARLGVAMVREHVLPFEIAGLILLVSLIGAILIAREEEK